MTDFYKQFEHYLKHGDHQQLQSFMPNKGEENRLLIYRNTYFSACIDILKRKYPSCVNLLGDDYFKMLARQYTEQYIPKSSVLAEYGELMPDFIRAQLKQHSPDLEYAADLATLDKAWHGAYFAADESPATAAEIESWLEDIESKRFALGASVQLVENNWSVAAIWPELKNGLLEKQSIVEKTTEYTILWRDTAQIFHRTLPVPEWTFIYQIYQGNTLIEAAEVALATGELEISTVFSQLLSNNLLKEINTP